MYESLLFFDPQAVRPGGFCPICGGECYRPGLVCLRCERRDGYEPGRAER